jgi:hypothetical protein
MSVTHLIPLQLEPHALRSTRLANVTQKLYWGELMDRETQCTVPLWCAGQGSKRGAAPRAGAIHPARTPSIWIAGLVKRNLEARRPSLNIPTFAEFVTNSNAVSSWQIKLSAAVHLRPTGGIDHWPNV